MRDTHVNVGSKIRAFRKRNKVSLTELSRLTGIAPSNLSSIELNKTSPTLSTLLRIAGAFGMRIGAFLDEVVYTKTVFLKEDEKVPSTSGGPEPGVHRLTTDVAFNKMDATLIVLASELKEIRGIAPGTDRLVYCLEGELTAVVEDQTYHLGRGDACYLLPDAVATLKADGRSRVSILVVSTPGSRVAPPFAE